MICGDNRFEIIAKAKEALIESTNIEDSPKEMAVLDNFLFRCWQMGWLDKYETEYNKDYFTGMKHLANAILYDLNRLAEYYKEKEEKARTCDGQEYYRFIKLGVEEAIDTVKQVLHMQDVVEKVLYTQLEAKGEK